MTYINFIQKQKQAIENYFCGTQPKGQLKEAVVEQKPPEKPKEEVKPWITAEKVAEVALKVITHPIVTKVVRAALNEKIERFEISAMELAAEKIGDKLLPGEVPAVKLAFMAISGLAAIARI